MATCLYSRPAGEGLAPSESIKRCRRRQTGRRRNRFVSCKLAFKNARKWRPTSARVTSSTRCPYFRALGRSTADGRSADQIGACSRYCGKKQPRHGRQHRYSSATDGSATARIWTQSASNSSRRRQLSRSATHISSLGISSRHIGVGGGPDTGPEGRR